MCMRDKLLYYYILWEWNFISSFMRDSNIEVLILNQEILTFGVLDFVLYNIIIGSRGTIIILVP